MASSAVHRALDGVIYRIEHEELALREAATSAVQLVVGGQLFEFTAGPAELGDRMADALGIDAFETELTFQGGTLRTATAREYDPQTKLVEHPTLVTWRGEHFSLVLRLYRATTQDALGLLRTVRIAEQEDGLTLTPDPEADCRFAGPAGILKEIPGVGLLEMSRRTKENAAQLPPWEGSKVPAGELYRDSLTDGRPFFVLSGPQIWATVVPLADTPVDDVPDLLGRLALHAAD